MARGIAGASPIPYAAGARVIALAAAQIWPGAGGATGTNRRAWRQLDVWTSSAHGLCAADLVTFDAEPWVVWADDDITGIDRIGIDHLSGFPKVAAQSCQSRTGGQLTFRLQQRLERT